QLGQERRRNQQGQGGGRPVHEGAYPNQPAQRDRSQHPLLQRAILGIAAEQGVQREQPGQQYGHPQHGGGDGGEGLRFAAQCERKQHHHQQGEQGGLQGVAASSPQQAQVAHHQCFGGSDQSWQGAGH